VLPTYTGDVQILRALKSEGSGLSSEEYISQRTDQIAEHSTDEALASAEVSVLTLIAAGNGNKQIADRLSITERNGQVAGQEHSLQVGCPRPDRHDRAEARHHQNVDPAATYARTAPQEAYEIASKALGKCLPACKAGKAWNPT